MDREYKRFKERKKQKEKVWKFVNNFIGSFGHGTWIFASVFGFLISQLFWVWLLKGFVGFFYNYLNELSEFTFSDHVTRTTFIGVFWLIYFVWFVVTILYKFKFRTENKEKTK